MEHSLEIAEFSAAFCKAQGAFGEVVKNAEVKTNSYDFKYATLDVVIASVRPALSANNLSFMQSLVESGNGAGVETLIIHASGQWVKAFHPIKIVKADNQGVGSALTYGRRYALAALMGIAVDSDDDGNEADGKKIVSVTEKKSPAGISAVKVAVNSFFGELEGCTDVSSLESFLETADAKKSAVQICRDFPDLWVSTIPDEAGLRVLIVKAGKRVGAEATVQSWIVKVEKAAKGPK